LKDFLIKLEFELQGEEFPIIELREIRAEEKFSEGRVLMIFFAIVDMSLDCLRVFEIKDFAAETRI